MPRLLARSVGKIVIRQGTDRSERYWSIRRSTSRAKTFGTRCIALSLMLEDKDDMTGCR
jgi:hypothetical protein